MTTTREARRLEIGGPPSSLPGFQQLPPEVLWGTDPLPYPEDHFDEVYSSHVIEHVEWWKTRDAMREAVRVLASGGTLEIHTVDVAYLVHCYGRRACGDRWRARGKNEEMHPIRWLASRLFSLDEERGGRNWHRAVFDWEYLVELFEEAGLVEMERVTEPRGREKHGPINVGIRGWKP